jgi:hypothetical protein
MDSASCKAYAAESKRVETDAWHAWWSLSDGAKSPRRRLGGRKVPAVSMQDDGRERRASVMAVHIWRDGGLVGSLRIAVYF